MAIKVAEYTVEIGEEQRLEQAQGEDCEYRFTFTASGLPRGMSGAQSIAMTMRDRNGQLVFARSYSELASGSSGTKSVFRVLASDTDDLAVQTYDVDVRWTDASGYAEQTLRSSPFDILDGIGTADDTLTTPPAVPVVYGLTWLPGFWSSPTGGYNLNDAIQAYDHSLGATAISTFRAIVQGTTHYPITGSSAVLSSGWAYVGQHGGIGTTGPAGPAGADGSQLISMYAGASSFPATAQTGAMGFDTVDHKLGAFDGLYWWEHGSAFAPVPVATGLSDYDGTENDLITIFGDKFFGVTSIDFNGAFASFTAIDPRTIQTTVPGDASDGPIYVRNLAGAAGTTPFTFLMPALERDYSLQLVASGVISGRSGGDLFVSRGLTMAARLSAGSTGAPPWEDRGSGVAGFWVLPGYTNLVASGAGFYVGGSPWSLTNIAVGTGATGPDLAQTASTVRDTITSTFSILRYSLNQSGYMVSSLWMREHGASPPTSAGAFACAAYPYSNSVVNDASQGFTHSAFFPTSHSGFWRRISHLNRSGGGSIQYDIRPAGQQDASSNVNQSALGSIELSAVQTIRADYDLPFVEGGTTDAIGRMSDADAAALVSASGIHNVKVRWFSPYFLPQWVPTGWIWKAQASGSLGVHYSPSGNVWEFYVRDAIVATGSAGFGYCEENTGRLVGESEVWTYYDPAGSTGHLRVSVGGCNILDVAVSATGSLAQPSSAWFGSDLGASGTAWPMLVTARNSYKRAVPFRPEGLIVGDSIMSWSNAAGFNGSIQNMAPAGAFIYSVDQARGRTGIASIAHAGDTIAAQRTAIASWFSQNDYSQLRWAIVQIGVNDVIADTDEQTIAGRYNLLVSDLKTRATGISVIANTMTPASAQLSPSRAANWRMVNAAIGATLWDGSSALYPITGVDYRVPYPPIMDKGSGYLADRFSQDGIHPNNPGKAVMMSADVAALQSLGLLP